MKLKKHLFTLVVVMVLLSLVGLGFLVVRTNKRVEQTTPDLSAIARSSFRGILPSLVKAEEKLIAGFDDAKSIALDNDIQKNESRELNWDLPADFTFAVIGDTQSFDSGSPKGYFQKALAQLRTMDPQLVIAVGDLISGCDNKTNCAKEFRAWQNELGDLKNKTYAARGNHDRVTEDADSAWREVFSFPANGPSGFSETAYSFDYHNSHFVFLDSEKPEEHIINSAQRKWLENDLTATEKENIFVFFHEPAYPVSNKATESLDFNPSERNALWTILEKHKVTAVFNGHEHIVSRRKAGEIYQFVFGSTDSFNHSLPASGIAEYASKGQGRFGIVEVRAKEITVKTFDSNGKELNSFTFSK